MWQRFGRWLAERWRRQWRKEGPYGLILPAVVVFFAAEVLDDGDGDRSAVAWVVSVALGLAVWLFVRWLRNDPSTDRQGDRSS